jgi:NAD(P)-dependent dehydrogenase (short-subunit alcohol dehydrogenase family)
LKGIEDQVIMITGSTDGIGMLTAHDLAGLGATVLLHGRDLIKGERVLGEIEDSTGNGHLQYYNADLSSLDDIRALASQVFKDHPTLDVLVNNAGIGDGRRGEQRRETSADGYELRLAVNYLAPFLLTHLLLPSLMAAEKARVVDISSLSQADIDFDDLMLQHDYSGKRAYGQSKLALAMFSFEMARRTVGWGITVNALHPGSLLDTKMVRETFGRPMGPAQEGADAEVFLTTSQAVDGITGQFFVGKRKGRASPQAYDRTAQLRLYEISLDLTGIDGVPFH